MSRFGIQPIQKVATIEYKMHNLTLNNDKFPILIVKPANDTNKPYISALLRTSAQVRRGGGAPTLKALERNREEDIELYAKYIITDWKNVIDEDGVEVDFTAGECEDFLNQIVKDNSWIFDDLRMFCSDMSNFIKYNEDEDLLKNS